VLFLSSCAAQKEVVKAEPKTIPANTDKFVNIPDSIRKNQLNFSTLSVKAKADINIGKKNNDATLTIRVKKNEAIWVAVTALAGVEVARALITPDSVKLMNKLDNTYLKKPFSYLHEFAGDELDFNMLQAILIGNVGDRFLTGTVAIGDQGPELSGSINSLKYKLLFNQLFKLNTLNLNDSSANQELAIAYNGWSLANGQELPQQVSIKSTAENNLSIDLEYSKAVYNQPVDMPFTVPKRFEVIN
jgi:hypothetical protein